jgi:protein MpaA
MASITATLLTLPTALVIGHSVEGRPIEAMHVGGNGPVVLVVGCIHGNECAALPVVAALAASRPGHEDLWLISVANPDGTAHDNRLNSHGVDLNRDFPNGREPETRALVAFIRRIHPAITIWFHQPQTVVRAWGRSRAAAHRYAEAVGLRYAAMAWPPGAATRWQNGLDETAFVVELAPGRLDADAIRRHVRAILQLSA